jgi:carboxypeptidase C (cathepsin A)
MDKNMTVTTNPYSWNNYANIMYVDQPVGTGFSYADHYADYVKDETGVAEDMYQVSPAHLHAARPCDSD